MSIRKSFDNEASIEIGTRIRRIRGARTQAQFAKLLGVDRATLSNYESGRRQPNSEILKKIASMGNTTVPGLLFGETRTPFDDYLVAINENMAIAAAKEPGFIPKWYISQDEIDLIFALRLMYDDSERLEIIERVVRVAEAAIEHEREVNQGKAPPYGEANIQRLRKILETGKFNEGYDPDVQLWATLWEEIKTD